MKLLIIGGTRFVGRAITDCALQRGHEITLFHRGHSNNDLFDVEQIFGDRDGETDKLAGREWDAVIDTCGYHPRVVEQSADTLCDNVGLYCFISTISVYADDNQRPVSEAGKLIRFAEPPKSEEVTGETYGGFKVLCEETINHVLGGEKALHIRPGLIIGPHDTTDRFTYWVDRFSRDGEVLVPDRAQQPIQFIDVRDLADFTVRMVEQGSTGVFNADGPAHDIRMGEVWSVLKDNCGGLPKEVIVSDQFLKDHEVKDWQDLPFVTPKDDDITIVDVTKAIDCGLTLRPLRETVVDTAEWHKNRGEIELKTGMSRQRERELLAEWKSR